VEKEKKKVSGRIGRIAVHQTKTPPKKSASKTRWRKRERKKEKLGGRGVGTLGVPKLPKAGAGPLSG